MGARLVEREHYRHRGALDDARVMRSRYAYERATSDVSTITVEAGGSPKPACNRTSWTTVTALRTGVARQFAAPFGAPDPGLITGCLGPNGYEARRFKLAIRAVAEPEPRGGMSIRADIAFLFAGLSRRWNTPLRTRCAKRMSWVNGLTRVDTTACLAALQRRGSRRHRGEP